MKSIWGFVALLIGAAPALAQDQQLGARTRAMGGSYTAFEDDPVSIWLNPAGISTQPDQMSISYQTYTTYPLHREKPEGNDVVEFSADPETSFVDPVLLPSYLGFVFHLGDAESGAAIGICYARPYHLNYSFDQVDDPLITQFSPDSNVEQSFHRFRVSFAKDFRIVPAGGTGFLTHVSVGAGLDLGYETWNFSSATDDVSDNATGVGFGLGVLLGVYDDGESLRINFGVAYQSAVKWDFNVDPDVFPAFDMPQQLNVGVTFYLLKDTPLRMTFDFQWIDWSETADVPYFVGQPSFVDSVNLSFGVEYRIPVPEWKVSIYPRLGFRRFDAPWEDENDLPMTGQYKLVLNTEGETFNIVTFGVGVAWSNEQGKGRSLDLAGDVGGDSFNVALGFNYEF